MNLSVPQHGSRVGTAVQQLINLVISTIAVILGWQLDSVANIAALATVDDTRIPDGSTKQVRTLWDTFTLNKSSTEVVDGITVVATMSGTGRWIRELTPLPVWSYQTTWFVNATTGDDENNGVTSLTALATFAEFQRRVQPNNVRAAMTVMIETDLPVTDPIAVCCSGQTVTVEGVPTVVYTGTVNTFTQNPAANEIGDLNDAGWTVATHIHRRVRFTSGAANGMVAFILEDLGGNSARISAIIQDVYGYGTSAAPAPGDTFVVETMPEVSFEDFSYQGALNIGNLKNQDVPSMSPVSIHSTWYPQFKSFIGDLGVLGNLGIATNCLFGFLNANSKSLYLYSGAVASVQQNYSDLRLYLNVVAHANIPSSYTGFYLYDCGVATVELGDIWFYGNFGTDAINCGIAAGFRFDANRLIRGDITGTTRFATFDDGAYIYTVNNNHTLALLDVRFARANVTVDLNTECPLVDPHSGSFAGNVAGGGSGALGPMSVGVKGALTAGTRYALQDYTEAAAAADMPIIISNRVLLRNLRLHLGAAPGGADTVSVQVYVDDGGGFVATGIIATISAAETDAFDIVHSYLAHPGDLVAFEVIKSGAVAENLSVSLEAG